MVRQWQQFFWNGNYSKTCLKQDKSCPRNCRGPGEHCRKLYLPDFVKLAEACGVTAMRTSDPKEVDRLLKDGFAHKGPVLMEFMTKQTENVYPMVPAGEAINKIIGGLA